MSREVPPTTEIFNLACATREACRKYPTPATTPTEPAAVSLLAVAALQIQTAQVGARMADMSNDGTRTQTLEAIATDYEGVSGAALNLSIRCSVTVVDLC